MRHFQIETKVRKETKMKGRRNADACRVTLAQTIPIPKGLTEEKMKKQAITMTPGRGTQCGKRSSWRRWRSWRYSSGVMSAPDSVTRMVADYSFIHFNPNQNKHVLVNVELLCFIQMKKYVSSAPVKDLPPSHGDP